MQRLNLYEFYDLGSQLAPLKQLSGDVALYSGYFPLSGARAAVGKLLSGSFYSVSVGRRTADDLLSEVGQVIDKYYSDTTKDWAAEKIPGWIISTITRKLERLEHVLAEELRQTSSYLVPDVGIFRSSGLVDEAQKNIPDDLLEFINDKAVDDYKSAGKCLAFGLYTAVGFHVLRATEGVLIDYAEVFCGKMNRPPKGWADYISALKAVADDGARTRKPNKKTVRDLDQLRDLDRNPVMHPHDVLNSSQARVIFNNATSAILAMTMEMKELKGNSAQTVLPVPIGDDPLEF